MMRDKRWLVAAAATAMLAMAGCGEKAAVTVY
jgi:hypothetical protein